jgi:hypothetical protein
MDEMDGANAIMDEAEANAILHEMQGLVDCLSFCNFQLNDCIRTTWYALQLPTEATANCWKRFSLLYPASMKL